MQRSTVTVMARYVVTQLPDRTRWVILDRKLFGFCTLPDSGNGTDTAPNLLPLEWSCRAGAEAWLHRCYIAWESGRVRAPRAWRPLPDTPSPWSVNARL